MAWRVAVAAYARCYADPVILPAGAPVVRVPRDDDEPGWVWCRDPASGRAVWVPEVFLSTGPDGLVLTRFYDAIELSVAAGERVEPLCELAGWVWCRAADGRKGWVPAQTLADLVDGAAGP